MFLKTIRLYAFAAEALHLFRMSSADPITLLPQVNPVEPIGDLQESRFGWVRADEFGPGMVWFTGLLQEKKIPPATLKRYLHNRCRDVEKREGRYPGSKERAEIREQIRIDMLPYIVPTFRELHGWVDMQAGLLAIDAPSDSLADTFVAHLREGLGSLPVVPVGRDLRTDLLTKWYQENGAMSEADEEVLTLGHKLALQMPNDPTVKSTHTNLDHDAPEIKHGLDSGMRVVKLAVHFNEAFTGVVDTAGVTKSVKWGERVLFANEGSDDHNADMVMQAHLVRDWFTFLGRFKVEG